MATALVFFHKFFILHSFLKHERLFVASACLFLAAKVEVRFFFGRRFLVKYTSYLVRVRIYTTVRELFREGGGRSGVGWLIGAAACRVIGVIGGIGLLTPPRRFSGRVECDMDVASAHRLIA